MAEKDLRNRTFAFAVSVARFTEHLPKSRTAEIFGRQLLRSSSAVGANYRAAGRAQSVAHLISKLAIVEEEADECGYWIELLVATGSASASEAEPLQREASEITAMIVASKKRLRARAGSTSRRNSNFAIRNSSAEA